MENRKRKWSEWVAQIRSGEKLPRKNQLLIVLLTGILLLVIVWPVQEQNEQTDPSLSSDEDEKTGESSGEYEEYLERKTEQILGEMKGVGEVTVMLTLRSGTTKIVEKDKSETGQNMEESDSEGGSRVTENTTADTTSVYIQDADGSSVPYVSRELTPEVEGVVVIADGGDDAVVARNITEAVQALFGVEAHKIKIMKRA